jgi:ferredoxin-type protein NapH
MADFDTLITVIFAGLVIAGSILSLRLVKDKTKRISTLRLFIQIAAVLGIFFGLIIGPFNTSLMAPLGIAPRDRLALTNILGLSLPDGISFPVLGCYFGSGRTVTCPIWQVQAYIFPLWNTGSGYGAYYSMPGIERLAIVFGTVIILSLLFGRLFCGWLCPFGLYMDLLTRIRKVFKKPHLNLSKKTNSALSQFGFIMLTVSMILSVIFGAQAIFGVQLVSGTASIAYNMGEGGDVNNYLQAPFCLVCPMRPLCILVQMGTGFMNPSYVEELLVNFGGPFYAFGWYVTSINLTILVLVTIGGLAYRRFWCRICPLGGLIGLFSTYAPFKWVALTRLVKDEIKCTKCGICKRVCPPEVTEMYDKKGGDVTDPQCILCARCVEMCPYEGALKINLAKKTLIKSRNWLKTKDK